MRYIKMANMTSTVLLGKSHNYAIYTYLVFTTGLMAAGMWGASFVSYDTTKLSLVGLALFWTAITNGIMCFQLVVKTLNSLKQDVRLENEINGRSTCNIEVQVRRSKLFLMIAFGSLVAFDFACVITFCIVANLSINNGLAFDKLQDIFSAVVALGSIHVLISSLLMDSFRNKLRQTLIDRVNTKAVLEGAGVSKSVVGGGVGLVGGRSTSTNSLNENNSGSKNGTIKLPRSSSHKAALGGSKLVASTSMNNVVRPSIQHPATINTNNPPLYPWDA